MITQWFACIARDDRLKRLTLSVVSTLVDHDLSSTISLGDFARINADQRPVEPGKRRIVKISVDDGADVGKFTVAMCRWLVKLATATY